MQSIESTASEKNDQSGTPLEP